MAGLKSDENGNRLITFRYAGRQFTRSAGTKNPRDAEAVKRRVEATLFNLKRGFVSLPPDAEPGEFIVSGGTRTSKAVLVDESSSRSPLTLAGLFALYEDDLPQGAKADTTNAMEGYHKAHLLRVFGPDTALDTIALPEAQVYANRRAKERYRDRPIRPQTVLKELSTFRVVWNWARGRGHLKGEFPFKHGDLKFARGEQKAPFRTFDDIWKIIERGGLKTGDESDLWESLYLNVDEVHEVLAVVKETASHPFVLPMFAMAAFTGARRSEICRSRVEDWKFGDDQVVFLRENKRVKRQSSFRTVDLNPDLSAIMGEWLANHPGGQFTLCKDGKPLTVDMATDHFKRTLRGTTWQVIPGFHTFRHSFASILASGGVDETTIDRWMGHQTKEQRERYRHLFPGHRKTAIISLSKPT